MTDAVEEVEALVAHDRYEAAVERLTTALEQAGDDVGLRWRLRLRRAALDLADRRVPVDETIFELEALLADDGAHEHELARAHAYRISAFSTKRCPDLGEEAVKAARDAVGEHPRVLVAEGRAALAFDDRGRARTLYERALEVASLGEDASIARLALADLWYVLGDFARCRETLDEIKPNEPRYVRALRLRAAVHAALQEHGEEAAAWEQILERVPEGDFAVSDRLARAFALASDGRREQALEQFRIAWRADPDASIGRYARKRIEYLERALERGDDAEPARRLPAFPTTSQKWNYCGPAVLELCLRYLDLELTQDEIAEAVKRETGTPMYEIVTFLRQHGIAARRIEATPERLRAAIDLGLPVIVQEEYSTTSHVAVITGYDASLGMFVANDPATHRPLMKSFEWTERAGDLFGNGGVIVLGREGSDLEALQKKCDEAGLVEARHLALLDQSERLKPSAGAADGGREDVALHEVLRLCGEAIELSPRFKLAWHRRLDSRNRLFRLTGRPDAQDAVLEDLHHVRTTFAGDEWPHQLHAHWLFDECRYEEAFVEYFEASRRDPDDANNLQSMGECMWLSGDLRASEEHMLESVAVEPHHVRAAENLSAVYLRQLAECDRRAAQEAGEEPEEGNLGPPTLHREIERSVEDLARRAWHFSRVARSGHPSNAFNHEVAGDLLSRRGDWEGAVAAFERARELDDQRQWPIWSLARALEKVDRAGDAEVLLEEGTTRFWHNPRGWLALAGLKERRGALDEAAKVLERGIETMESNRDQLARDLFRILASIDSGEAAAARLRELAEARASDGALLREVGYLLDERRQRGHAVALLRHAVDAFPDDVNATYRLGNLLAEDLLTREEGRALLERVIEMAPDAPQPRRQLAWLRLEDGPAQGLTLLDPVMSTEDPYVYETRAALLEALGRDAEAARTFELALEAHGTPIAGILSLTGWHLDAQRYERAVALAKRIFDHEVEEEDRKWAESNWLAAHRLAGASRDALPKLRELCADGVPRHLAFEVYWACRSIDDALAARAALVMADKSEDGDTRRRWRVHAAQELAQGGDEKLLAEVVVEAEEHAEAWALLSYCYAALKRWGEANEAARKAVALEPGNREALSAMEEAHVREGDVDAALGCARELVDRHPYEHVGPERLGALLGKSLDVDEALKHSHIAVDAAPFCHNAHWSRALAWFAADDMERAAVHARRSLALEEPDEEDAGNDCLMILRALEGDADGVRRCLATLHESQPESVFADYKKKLLAVAERTR